MQSADQAAMREAVGLSGSSSLDLPIWSSALTDAAAGTRSARLAVIGDSNAMGHTTSSTGARIGAWPNKLTKYLPEHLGYVRNAGVFGDQKSPVSYPTYDGRMVLGSGWAAATANENTLGGQFFSATTATSGLLEFTPNDSFDRFHVYHTAFSTGGDSVDVTLDGGGSIGTLDGRDAVSQVVKTTFDVAEGIHTIQLGAPLLGSFYVLGIECERTDRTGVSVFQFGWYGARTDDISASGFPWSPLNAIDDYAPDLTIIALTINDAKDGKSLVTYTAELQSIVDAAQLAGSDIILMASHQPGTTAGLDGTYETYRDAARGIADAEGFPFLDFFDLFGSYAQSDDFGRTADLNHLTVDGYDEVAEIVSRFISNVNF